MNVHGCVYAYEKCAYAFSLVLVFDLLSHFHTRWSLYYGPRWLIFGWKRDQQVLNWYYLKFLPEQHPSIFDGSKFQPDTRPTVVENSSLTRVLGPKSLISIRTHFH